jgi:hypothetical protein
MSSTAYALLERMSLSEGPEAVAWNNQPTTLTTVLGGLALQPFSAASVARYKQEKAKEANAWLWLHRALLGFPYLCFACVMFGLGLVCAGALAQQHDVQRVYVLTGVAAALVGAFTLIMSSLIRVKDRAVWEIVPKPEYQGRIPAAVMLTLCEIEANLPKVEFVVHRLVQNREALDPFIEAQYGHESYVIAVWDETYTA